MNISIVVAISQNNAIGKNNQLLWHLPADLKHFKEITSGNCIIMGRKTYDSIGRPLPNRRNVVITRNTALKIEDVEIVTSLEDAISLCENEKEIFIIGGAEIYKEALALTDTIYLTTVHQHYDADAFFPEIKSEDWLEIDSESHKADEKNKVDYTFSTLKRR
ncbi:dihydrofolate reductase [Pedobacter namyangjuensis]|uniref:dihydrofolate reductase n=1 Tax=Pedobacter namyangjuensis TaxID=600626 RepID=UPI000DE2ED2D|nr:dihydrofolate reductase [Pedobacter namyangjuensis]